MGSKTSGVVGVALSALALVFLLTGLSSALAVDPDLVGHWRLDGNATDSAGGKLPIPPPSAPRDVTAIGHDSRIDLR